MFSVLRKAGPVCVILGLVALAATDARSVGIDAEVADELRSGRGLNANFSLVDSLPKIDTDKASKFNTAALQGLFNNIYSPQNDQSAVKSSVQQLQLQGRAADQPAENNRQARAGVYYSPDDQHFFPLSQDPASFYPQYHPQSYLPRSQYHQSYYPQSRAFQIYSELLAESPSAVQESSFEENSEVQLESRREPNAEDAEGRFFILPVSNVVSGGVSAGISTGTVNTPVTSVGTTFGTQDGFTAGIRKLFAIGKPSVVTVNTPNTVVQATPLVTKYLPFGLFPSANIVNTNNNNNAAIAPSSGSNGIVFFKGITRQ